MSDHIDPQDGPGLAVFDLDYTLTKRGTWGRFVWRWVRYRPHIWLPLLLSAGFKQWQYKRGKCPRQDVKLAMMRWAMKGAARKDMLQRGAHFAQNEVKTGLRPKARGVIAQHKARGDHLIMISAAVDVIAQPIGELLGFEAVLSTEMSFDDQERLELKFSTPNCYGAEKCRRFHALLEKRPFLKQYHTKVTFYSDSISDLDMFLLSQVSICVHPDMKLSRLAIEKGWPIANWS